MCIMHRYVLSFVYYTPTLVAKRSLYLLLNLDLLPHKQTIQIFDLFQQHLSEKLRSPQHFFHRHQKNVMAKTSSRNLKVCLTQKFRQIIIIYNLNVSIECFSFKLFL